MHPPRVRRYSCAELERMADELLAANPEPREERDGDDGAFVEWQWSPSIAPDADCDDDAAEIAATFADLSGGRFAPRIVAWAYRVDEVRADLRRSYMRDTRARNACLAKAWRQRERDRVLAMLADAVRGPELRRQWAERKRLERRQARMVARALRAIGDLFSGGVRGAEGT